MSRARYRWVVLAAGTFAQAGFSASSVGLPALGPALKSHYGLTLGETGVVLAGIGIGMLFTLLPWGLVADRVDERWVIAAGLTGAAAMLLVASTTDGFATVTGVLVAVGALGASVNAASGRAIMAWFPSSELGTALGIRQTAIPIGGALGALVLPVLASAGGTRAAFLFLAGACACGAFVAATFIRTGASREPALGVVSRPVRDPRMWLLGTGTGLFLTAQIGITGFVVLFLYEHRHVSAHAAAVVLAAIEVLAIAARIGSGAISDRVGSRLRPLRAIGIALALFTAAVASATDAPLALVVPLFLVAGVLSMAWNGLAYAAAAEMAGAARTGAALGFQQTLLGVVVAGSPPFVAIVAGHSWRLAFLLAAVGPAVGVGVLRRLAEPEQARRVRPARTPGTSASLPAAPRTPD
ncbi:MAG TPA: MFS transporter [Gaiellaceae bacterium]|nr:MFS transporter [Gaiellaceae bacterium]